MDDQSDGVRFSATRLNQILDSPSGEPLIAEELARRFNVREGKELEAFREFLRAEEIAGRIARVRGDRYTIPARAQLCAGRIHFHERGFAWILSETPTETDLFIPAELTGAAFHGDRVLARVQESPRGRKQTNSGFRRRGTNEWREGRVIRILERGRKVLTGVLQKAGRFLVVAADDPRFIHHIYVPEEGGAQPGDKVVVRLLEWKSRHLNPEGEIVEVLGRSDDPSIWGVGILRKFDLCEEFPDAANQEAADALPPDESGEELLRREDCREQWVLTIDPDDARDFDDAIFVERRGDVWHATVHIADVSHYVRPGSALDKEALRRGNSVYLVDRVIPMLPERLSNDLCSLRPDEERFAFSCFLEFNCAGLMKRARFARTIIRSRVRLSYKEAFALLQRPPTGEAGARVHAAWALAKLLRERRFARGSLDLDFPEIKIRLDKKGRPVGIEKTENDISHQLIEELMLAANEAAARTLRGSQVPAIYRVHERPDPDKLFEFRELLAAHGIRVGSLSAPGEVQRMLKLIRGRQEEYALKVAFLRSLRRACYNTQPTGHYGLAKADYLHFTSPIRRYADLVVHRALACLAEGRGGPFTSAQLSSVAEHISETERAAAEAEREHKLLMQLEFFREQQSTGESFNAIVMDVRSLGLFVDLPDYLISGLVHASKLGRDFYQFDAVAQRFVNAQRSISYGLGTRCLVRVAGVDMIRRQIDFAMVEPADSKPASRRNTRRN